MNLNRYIIWDVPTTDNKEEGERERVCERVFLMLFVLLKKVCQQILLTT